jgi:hypothetical protein
MKTEKSEERERERPCAVVALLPPGARWYPHLLSEGEERVENGNCLYSERAERERERERFLYR